MESYINLMSVIVIFLANFFYRLLYFIFFGKNCTLPIDKIELKFESFLFAAGAVNLVLANGIVDHIAIKVGYNSHSIMLGAVWLTLSIVFVLITEYYWRWVIKKPVGYVAPVKKVYQNQTFSNTHINSAPDSVDKTLRIVLMVTASVGVAGILYVFLSF